MDIKQFVQRDETSWEIPAKGTMRVPAVIYGDVGLLESMDQKVCEQISHVASLPGIVEAAYAMPIGATVFRSAASLPSIRNRAG